LKITGNMYLKDVLKKFPFLKDKLYRFIDECVNCEGFMDEPIFEVFKAHGLNPKECIEELNRCLEEENEL